MSRTLGQHIASRLTQIGVDSFFAVPGDFNLVLLDQFLKSDGPKLRMINTCNELNAGYAADGYARAKGAACVIATFTVGGLSLINAIAGAYSEDLPVICIVGGPNSNDFGTNRVLHHTIGIPDFHQELKAFSNVTCHQVQITHLDDAHEQVDHAIAEALRQQKPVYISISCNIAGIPHSTFDEVPVPFAIEPKLSNPRSLEAAVNAAAEFLNKAVKPVLVAGVKLRPSHAEEAFLKLADACEYPVAVQPNAKGMFPEGHTRFIGTYWGQVSSAYCSEVVEASDAYLFAGPLFNDYSSVGYSLLIKKNNLINVHGRVVSIGGNKTYQCIEMRDFLTELAKKLKKNSTAWDNHQRMYLPQPGPPTSAAGSPLRTNVLYKHIESMLTPDSAVIAETGDSWFNCQKLKLPDGCGYEFQMQYGSIGWAVGATLGYSAAVEGKKRVIASIGDGSFQVTAQDLSTMIRYGFNTIIFLINNGGYTIEVEIHDGPYNVIKNWDYVALCKSFDHGEGAAFATRVTTEDELLEAIKEAQSHTDKLCFIECIIHKDDCSKELLEWGSRVSAANSRPPKYDV